jgi:hypothetical protein
VPEHPRQLSPLRVRGVVGEPPQSAPQRGAASVRELLQLGRAPGEAGVGDARHVEQRQVEWHREGVVVPSYCQE